MGIIHYTNDDILTRFVMDSFELKQCKRDGLDVQYLYYPSINEGFVLQRFDNPDLVKDYVSEAENLYHILSERITGKTVSQVDQSTKDTIVDTFIERVQAYLNLEAIYSFQMCCANAFGDVVDKYLTRT